MKKIERRNFLKLTSIVGVALPFTTFSCKSGTRENYTDKLNEILSKPVLIPTEFDQPLLIETIELLEINNIFYIRTRTKNGLEGISVTNKKIDTLYPILLKLVIPYFIGKDARNIENLIDEVYVYKSNYKMQSLALWCCIAWVEFSVLDLLGKADKKHISQLFGNKIREKVPIYVASGNRGTTPEEEIEILQKKVEQTGAKAIKFKVGGRMSKNADSITGRSEKLIELSRQTFGSEYTIQADANGSYDVKNAIRVGKLLESINAYLFEEPCRFDHIDETKQVADALKIPISGGEQESSEYRFKNMILNDVVQIVQPDLHYYGGFIRTTRVARMAEILNKSITIHISNSNAGYAEMVNFSSFTPNIGLFQELKTGMEATSELFEPSIKVKDGYLNVPKAYGMGMQHAEEYLKNARVIKDSSL